MFISLVKPGSIPLVILGMIFISVTRQNNLYYVNPFIG
jgi:hypothetical protein